MNDPQREGTACRLCGAPIPHVAKRNPALYCSRAHRRQWYRDLERKYVFRMHNYKEAAPAENRDGGETPYAASTYTPAVGRSEADRGE